MTRQIVVISGPDAGRTFALPESDALIIGRSKSTAFPLADPEVSRMHCKLEAKGNVVVVSDLDSTGGTFVNDQPIRAHKLQPGDVVRLGTTVFKVDTVNEDTTLHGKVKAGAKRPVAQPPSPPRKSEMATSAAPALQTLLKAGNLSELCGQVVSHYKLGEVLARGRSGVVFRAKDTRNGRAVAVKVLKPDLMEKDEERRRFIRAMKTVLPLDHPNLVKVYGAGQKNALCWISMEFVDGQNLLTMIQRMGVAGRLDWRHAFRMAHDITQALHYIAGRQIVHRNIVPQNILVRTEDRLAKLNDLMLAKALEGTGAKQITKPGELLGELCFLPPERTHGVGEDDIRSDIYSLGATLYAMLTGQPPCDGGSPGKTIKLIREEVPPPPTHYQLATPGPISGLVMKMLAKRPEQRFQTPADVLEEINRVARVLGPP